MPWLLQLPDDVTMNKNYTVGTLTKSISRKIYWGVKHAILPKNGHSFYLRSVYLQDVTKNRNNTIRTLPTLLKFHKYVLFLTRDF